MTDVSIVFRNKDGTHTGKIYVNDYQAAAELASKFRNASHIVDVISIRDEVILRWQDGHPDWKYGQIKPIKLTTEPYRFERPDDAYWVTENRLSLLTIALQYAFDVITNRATDYGYDELAMHIDHHGGEDIWLMIDEAKCMAEQVSDLHDSDVWEAEISNWMADSTQIFIHYLVELSALSIYLGKKIGTDDIPRLGIQLASLAASRNVSFS